MVGTSLHTLVFKRTLATNARNNTVTIVRMTEVCLILVVFAKSVEENTAFTVRKYINVPVTRGIVLSALISLNVLIVKRILALTVSP
mmetsp:Transcript_32228/g.48663  ORF Transcript_32228/g.48663 Transcript_32228/m.48663 type:complete len:87 (-) Transcript_32228:183-443(-)